MALLELSSTRQTELDAASHEISLWLTGLASKQRQLFSELRILGPGVPAIAKVRHSYRRTMVVIAPRVQTLHIFLDLYRQRFPRLPAGVRQHLDIDPQNLL